ncbi:MAG TPA: bifunctional glycosyltransferase family 2/GtrA family protein [Puia sp.]|nr:bifunctional glycosyltransferase family 2/GtrA family protein [Puia sp.]
MNKPACIVIIPAYNPPDGSLLSLVTDLKAGGVEQLIVVNDGSSGHEALFEELEKDSSCIVLHHAVNLGKGRALKTAFNHILKYFPETRHVVTADADGQHAPEDIVRIIRTTAEDPSGFFIGVRSFGPDVPLRSRFGNILTRYIFRFLIGLRLSDTQSGLRAIPKSLLPALLKEAGEAYEFELAMLILVKHARIKVHELPIKTVYLNRNESSKFNPFIDSMKIYFVFFRFILSSLFVTGIDFAVFLTVYSFSKNILISLIFSRIISSAINFFVNLKFVFHRSRNVAASAFKYYLLVALVALLSYLLISLFHKNGVGIALAKIIAETILFFVSFTLQRDFVFNDLKDE